MKRRVFKLKPLPAILLALLLIPGAVTTYSVSSTRLKDQNMPLKTAQVEPMSLNTLKQDLVEHFQQQSAIIEEQRKKAEIALQLQLAEEAKRKQAEIPKQVVVASRGEGITEVLPASAKFVGNWKVTFYGPTGNNTANGSVPTPYKTIAIDPNYWHFGQKFFIEGFGVVTAQDTGGAIKGQQRADLFVPSDSVGTKLGVRHPRVWLLQ